MKYLFFEDEGGRQEPMKKGTEMRKVTQGGIHWLLIFSCWKDQSPIFDQVLFYYTSRMVASSHTTALSASHPAGPFTGAAGPRGVKEHWALGHNDTLNLTIPFQINNKANAHIVLSLKCLLGILNLRMFSKIFLFSGKTQFSGNTGNTKYWYRV